MKKLKQYSFPKQERLTLRKHIEALFQHGEAFSFSMFRILYRNVARIDDASPVQAGIAVPKKKIKKANQRNLIKRRIREAWRQNKHKLQPLPTSQLQIFLIYRSHQIAEFPDIHKAILQIIDRLNEIQNKAQDSPQ